MKPITVERLKLAIRMLKHPKSSKRSKRDIYQYRSIDRITNIIDITIFINYTFHHNYESLLFSFLP
jgi:hypothetical protein